MFDALRRQWRLLRQDPPGQRFLRLHQRRRQSGKRGPGGFILLLLGLALIALGLVLMPAPGPGLPVVALGAGLLASESKLAARALDAGELKIRNLLRRLRGNRS